MRGYPRVAYHLARHLYPPAFALDLRSRRCLGCSRRRARIDVRLVRRRRGRARVGVSWRRAVDNRGRRIGVGRRWVRVIGSGESGAYHGASYESARTPPAPASSPCMACRGKGERCSQQGYGNDRNCFAFHDWLPVCFRHSCIGLPPMPMSRHTRQDSCAWAPVSTNAARLSCMMLKKSHDSVKRLHGLHSPGGGTSGFRKDLREPRPDFFCGCRPGLGFALSYRAFLGTATAHA